MTWQWSLSDELIEVLGRLTRKQANAVLQIVAAEVDGIGLIRLLRTPYSCQYCGWVAGRAGEKRDARKARLAEHESICANRDGEPWRFAANFTTYYSKWTKQADFRNALELARRDVVSEAMQMAVLRLQANAGRAVNQVVTLIDGAEKEDVRLKASFGLLDRAGVETTVKQAAGATAPSAHKVDYTLYQDRPVGFSEEVLQSKLTVGQVEVLEAIRDHQVTVVQSANAVGKTYAGADAALWFVRSFRRAEVYMAAAPPLENLERLLWGELERRINDHPEPFADAKMGHLVVELGPSWWVNGVAIPSSGTPAQREAKFSGKHAPHLMFILDEGDAIPDEVYRGIESCMSGGHARLVVFFNPRDASGPVNQLIRAGAYVVMLDAFSHPNVTTGRTVVPGAVSRDQTVERINKWTRAPAPGEDSDADKLAQDPEWFQIPAYLDGATAKREDGTEYPPLVGGQWRRVTNPAFSYMVLARAPGQAENQLISRAWVDAAQQRWLVWQQANGDQPPEGIRPYHGQDVAELGQDRNVACFRYGGWVAPLVVWNGMDPLQTGDRAAQMAMERDAEESYCDATGVGAGVPPAMTRWWNVRGWRNGVARRIMVAAAPTVHVEEGEFALLRDQLWWMCREWLRADPGAMLPADTELADELCAVHYRVKNGKITIEDKESLRKTLRRSPDKADALVLTFANTVPRYAPTAYAGR